MESMYFSKKTFLIIFHYPSLDNLYFSVDINYYYHENRN